MRIAAVAVFVVVAATELEMWQEAAKGKATAVPAAAAVGVEA